MTQSMDVSIISMTAVMQMSMATIKRKDFLVMEMYGSYGKRGNLKDSIFS